MKPRSLILSLVAALSWPTFAHAQKGATITGTVVDSLQQPIRDADVILRPGNHRARSDSLGRFTLAELDDGNFFLAARKVGYAPDRLDGKLSKNGRLNVKLTLKRSVQLDTVQVVASRQCSEQSLDGFMCRQHNGGGVFLDYPDIDERGVDYTADLFKDIPGFRVALRSTRFGPERVAVASNGFGCITSLVDGRPVTLANPIPRLPTDLSAVEVYFRPDSVPKEYQRYTWPAAGITRSGRCSVVVYWTTWAKFNP
ncbi:MAG TPA: carboxypeptidase regulatory-like domain-containing protein [Gemmatimonadaceae bacterium]|nr:carboxypeptidase regulatory-like domain-containing protein [Gemmatimonadaceae bacterium]